MNTRTQLFSEAKMIMSSKQVYQVTSMFIQQVRFQARPSAKHAQTLETDFHKQRKLLQLISSWSSDVTEFMYIMDLIYEHVMN